MKKLKIETRTQIQGFLMYLPWLIGFLIFFLVPFIMTITYSFNKLDTATNGGLTFTYTGWLNYDYVFNKLKVNTSTGESIFFKQFLIESVIQTLIKLPLITVFSLVVAVLLNNKYRGQGLARVIFFLPLILGLPTVVSFFTVGDNNLVSIKEQTLYKIFDIAKIFKYSQVPESIISVISKSVLTILDVLMLSGVQILIFLAAIQSINPQLYEVAQIEGANTYEQFFKVTLPSIFPMLSAVIIYTLIDLLYRSPLVSLIMDEKISRENRAVISVIFTLVTLILLFIAAIFLRMVNNDKKAVQK